MLNKFDHLHRSPAHGARHRVNFILIWNLKIHDIFIGIKSTLPTFFTIELSQRPHRPTAGRISGKWPKKTTARQCSLDFCCNRLHSTGSITGSSTSEKRKAG